VGKVDTERQGGFAIVCAARIRGCVRPSRETGALDLSRLFDRVQKVSVVLNPVKTRARREAIVSTERAGGTDDQYTILGRNGRQIQNLVFRAFDDVRTLDTRVEMGEDMVIEWCSAMVCLIYNDNLQVRLCRIKLL